MIKDFLLGLNIFLCTLFFAPIVFLVGLFDYNKNYTGILIRCWAKSILNSSRIRYHAEGLQKIDLSQNYVIVSNHQSGMDVILTFALFPKPISFFTKKELFKIPIFGWAMKSAGMVKVDRFDKEKSKKCVDDAINKINSTNLSFLNYPEGTRSNYNDLLEFKKGGFILAVKSNTSIVPLTIIYKKIDSPIYRSDATLIFDKPISLVNYDIDKKDDLIFQVRNIIKLNIEKYFNVKIQ